VVEQAEGNSSGARSLCEESLALHRELGNDAWEAASLNLLGSIALDQGDQAAARIYHEQGLAIHRRLGDKWGIGYTLHELGRVAILAGDADSALLHLGESIPVLREVGDTVGIAETLEYFAMLAANMDDRARALHLAGAASAIRDSMGAPATAPDEASLEHHLARAREGLGPGRSAAEFERGKSLGLEEAVRLAMAARPAP
jgi:tetratricopeptide (TPR) repeat protein